MDKIIFGTLFLIVTVSSGLPLQAQSCSAKAPVSRTEPARGKSIPFSIEQRTTWVQAAPDGSTKTYGQTDVTAIDSEGRLLITLTSGASGPSSFRVNDPVAGTRTVWNTENHQAKVLKFPTPVPGRESCWRIPAEDRDVRAEEWLGLITISCPPAEQHQGEFCGARGSAVGPRRDASQKVTPSYEDCLQALTSGKFQKTEDLGVETIVGLEAHGCRSTDGTHTWELWWATFGPGGGAGTHLRRVVESHDGSGRTVKTTTEATSVRLGEPDAEMFHPPDGYAIKTVEMEEVPCGQANPQAAVVPFF
jgi:hypothetical protein